MGIFDFIFSLTSAGKLTTSACQMINSTRRESPALPEFELFLKVIEARCGKSSDVATQIIGNIYYQNFGYSEDEKGSDDTKFGLMDLILYFIYFELGSSPFQDRNLIGKIGQLMREQGFTSKEINGKIYNYEDFPEKYSTNYVIRREISIIPLNWRSWM